MEDEKQDQPQPLAVRNGIEAHEVEIDTEILPPIGSMSPSVIEAFEGFVSCVACTLLLS